MLKSKSIKDNKSFFELFVKTIKDLSTETLQQIKGHAHGDVLEAFTYFSDRGVTLDNLLLEIQEDFKEENLLLIDGSSITPEKQKHLNSLESKDNEYRAVFAVDMLNEGWDVLNLFDIVRLYDTRDSRNGVVGKTTNSEAQLIGRGARYMPFTDKPKETQSVINRGLDEGTHLSEREQPTYGTKKPLGEYASKRKFDSDINNPLRHLETLSYHSPSNPRYIQELNSALAQTGIIEPKSKEIIERLKDSFKETQLYNKGYVFVNEEESYYINEELTNIGDNILKNDYSVRISSGEMSTSLVFSKAKTEEIQSLEKCKYHLRDFGKHIIRAAINKFNTLTFAELHKIYPRLTSIKEFIESDDYLANLAVTVYGRKEVITALSQKEKLYVVIEALRQIEPMLVKGGIGKRGTKKFQPKQLRDIFHDHQYRVTEGGDSKEDGRSMKETTNDLLRLDLSKVDWYAYEDNYGTEEEKYLIKYIESIIDKLREKYNDIYLLRNHKDLKIYAFEDGRATEPDFVLFMRRKGTKSKLDNIQIFIEPKGEHLRKNDKWKEDFEKTIHDKGILEFRTENDQFEIWGLPFYTHSFEKEFDDAFNENYL